MVSHTFSAKSVGQFEQYIHANLEMFMTKWSEMSKNQANATSGVLTTPFSRARSNWTWSAEAKTSAWAPCSSWVRSWVDAPKLNVTGTPVVCS